MKKLLALLFPLLLSTCQPAFADLKGVIQNPLVVKSEGNFSTGQCAAFANTGSVGALISGITCGSGGGGTPGGSNTEIQYNNNGSFGGDTSTTDGSGDISLTTLTASGYVEGSGMVINGTNSVSLNHNGNIDYTNPNMRFNLPSAESFYWYNQGRGVNLLMYLNGSNGDLNIPSLTASELVQTDSSKNLISTTALPNGTTATTQSSGDSSTDVATDAFVQTAVGGAVTSISGDGTYITNSSSTGAVTLTNAFGTAALKNTGTSGSTVPLLNGNNTYSGTSLFTGSAPSLSNGDASVAASSTLGGLFTGQGSTDDITFQNKSGSTICTAATGTTTLNCTGLQVGGSSVSTQTFGTLTNGDYCTTNGTSISCTSTPVTSVATNNGLTGGTITSTGTLGLAGISNNGALCNNSGSTNPPTTANCTVTGTGNLVMATSPSVSSLIVTGALPSLSNGDAAIGGSSTGGGIYAGQGSTNDIELQNKSGANICVAATGTTTLNCTGLDVGGTAVLTANQNITLSGDTTGSGTTAITTSTVKVNGGSIPASANLVGTNSSSQFTAATSTSVINLFSGCSGTEYLGADGNCHSASGSGTVTSITVGTGLTGSVSPITTTGTISEDKLTLAVKTSAVMTSFGGL